MGMIVSVPFYTNIISLISRNSYDADFMEEDDLEAAFEDFLQETHSHYRMFPSYHP